MITPFSQEATDTALPEGQAHSVESKGLLAVYNGGEVSNLREVAGVSIVLI